MVTHLGTHLGTELGTDLGRFADGPPSFDTTQLYALSAFSTANYFATLVGGGEAGVDTGFGGVNLLRPRALQSANQIYGGRTGASTGWKTGIVNTNDLSLYTFPFLQTSNKLAAAKVGRMLVDFFQVGPTLTRVAQDLLDTSSTATLASYAPEASAAERIGNDAGNVTPSDATDQLGWLRWRGAPTDAQLRALANLIRTLGDVPSKVAAEALMPGTTVTHRWSLRDVLAATNLPVADGAPAPATIPDSVTLATVDAMSKTGAPIVRVIDPGAIEGRTTYGVLGFATASHLKTAGAMLGGTTVSVEMELTFHTALGSNRRILSNANGSGVVGGLSIYQSANQVNVFAYGPGLNFSFVIPAASVGYKQTLKVECTGTVWRLYLDGVQQGSDAAGTYLGSSWPLYVGVFGDASLPGDNITVWKLKCGSYAAPEQHIYDFHADIVANGGPSAGVPATILDRVGTDHLTRVGTGLQVGRRTERLWSYETTPIAQGIQGFTDADHYAGPTVESAAYATGGWFGSVTFVVPSQAIASQNRDLTGSYVAAGGGFLVRITGTATAVFVLGMITNTAVANGPTHVISAADVGKLITLTWTWDHVALRFRSMYKRVETAGTTQSFAYAPGTGTLYYGRAFLAARDANGIQTCGLQLGRGVLSTAEMQAHQDAVIAADGRMVAIPGRTVDLLIDTTLDVDGSPTAPATLANRAGAGSLARVGTPTVALRYTRTFPV